MSMNQLVPTPLATDQSTAATFTTKYAETRFCDNIGIQYTWDGDTDGDITVEVSLNPDVLGWYTLDDDYFRVAPLQPGGTPGTGWLEVNQSTAGYVRVTYTRSSGSGLMTIWITAKSV